MREIRISDITLEMLGASEKSAITFREKIEVARLLDRLGVSVIELGQLSGSIADSLLIKSVAASVKQSAVAVCPGFAPGAIEKVWDALQEAAKPRLQVCAAVSTARMEYVYHKKADAMLKMAEQAVAASRQLCEDVEFLAEDATRADVDYLCRVLAGVIGAGAGTVTICDTAGVLLPDEFADFVRTLYARVPELKHVELGVQCSNALHVADASAISALAEGASEIKVAALSEDTVSLRAMTKILTTKQETLGVSCAVRTTEINRILKGIERLCSKSAAERSPFEDGVRQYPEDMAFSRNDSMEDVLKGVAFLGYDLDEADQMRIWKAFQKITQRKESVSIGELEAIIASEAMQVPATYTLENYVVTTGNVIDIMAHVKLRKGSEFFDGLSIGDGPIDAAFLAIEKITGHHYELDDFQIQAITEGREAMGQTIVKLRSGGKVYSGRGISTDIVGSGVAAYINALNKILYEEETV